MEEVQSWWEVPAVAHFCYVFRSAFNLVFFEIAELESALLDMQDPDMCLSLEQLIMRILQGFENEPITEENWEETLDELFSENLEDNENPLEKNSHFLQLTTRTKLEVLFKLCELRLDVEDAMDAIKDIAPKDMNATCLGKDAQNNSYWYFYDERLYREKASSSNGKKPKLQNVKATKNVTSKSKMVNTREKRTKSNPDSSWSIACFSLTDWEKLIKMFSKSKNSHAKELVNNMKEQLSVVQESVAEKDRLLRKRFIEMTPKRISSRISKVQEKKKIDKMKAQEAAEKARLQADKERAKKEAQRKKLEIIERQKRVEERRKAIEEAVEERATRAKLREVAKVMDSDDSEESNQEEEDDEEEEEENDDDDEEEEEEKEKDKVLPKRGQKRKTFRYYKIAKYKSKNESNSEEEDGSNNESEDRASLSDSEQKRVKRFKPDQNKIKHTFCNQRNQIKQPSTIDQQRGSPRLRTYSKNVKYKSKEDSESEKEDEVSKVNEDTRVSPRLQKIRQNIKKQSNMNKVEEESSCDVYSNRDNRENSRTVHKRILAKENSPSHTYSNGSRAIVSRNMSSRISHYKNTVLQNSSDVSKWNSTFDSKGRKLHILHDDNLSSKKLKLQQVKTLTSLSPNLKSSLSKENQVYQPFHHKSVITYSKLSPTTIRLDFRKSPSNQQASS